MDTQPITEASPSAVRISSSPHGVALRMQLGFVDPVDNAQKCFRALLDAFGQPAIPVELNLLLPDFGLPTSAIATVLALGDVDTTLWLSPGLPETLRGYFRFHTGVRMVDNPADATFAFAECVAAFPPLHEFNPGAAVSPETSTTLIVPVMDFVSGYQVTLDGPGFQSPRSFSPAGFDEAIWEQLVTNNQRFPAGIDLVLCCETQVAGLPRSTRISTHQLEAPLGASRVTKTPLFDAARSSTLTVTNSQED